MVPQLPLTSSSRVVAALNIKRPPSRRIEVVDGAPLSDQITIEDANI